jgi:hypothetical protein
MAHLREPWYLFCGDPEFAEDCLLQDFVRSSAPTEQAWALKLLSQLGAWEAVEKLIKSNAALLAYADARAALMALRQHRNQPNPWLSLLPPAEQGPFLARWHPWLVSEEPLQVVLTGGLGDQLEAMALLSHPRWSQRLELVLPAHSQKALEALLSKIPQSGAAPRWRFGRQHPDRAWLSWMALQALLASAHVNLIPQTLFTALRTKTERLVVVCWRSKSTAGERFWGFLRSLPLEQITGIYSWMLPWAKEKGWRIVDLSRYSVREQRQLNRLPCSEQLSLAAPQLQSLADTATLVGKAANVLSVDTALIHLAHGLNAPRCLLLHRHPDPRWQRRLLQDGSSDQRNLRVLQQTTPQQWCSPLQQLRASLGA